MEAVQTVDLSAIVQQVVTQATALTPIFVSLGVALTGVAVANVAYTRWGPGLLRKIFSRAN